ATQPVPQPLTKAATQAASSGRPAGTKQCEVCGFPVSPERTLCLDCEAAREKGPGESAPAEAADFLSPSGALIREESWFERNLYTIGTIVVAALTVLALWLKFR